MLPDPNPQVKEGIEERELWRKCVRSTPLIILLGFKKFVSDDEIPGLKTTSSYLLLAMTTEGAFFNTLSDHGSMHPHGPSLWVGVRH